ncbi:MAG: class I SAM-dependent methyltransferase family protein, partial [Candidatus Omnitrophica bacterium]|nr:class I SAM-dependent methyltransferase family protein [Candidatus Omnitrophota bacterium]
MTSHKDLILKVGVEAIETSLRNKIKLYKKRAQEVEKYLSKKPDEWGKFQNEFNSAVNGIFRDIMNFEKINLASGNKDKVNRLKRLFINRIRGLFMRGVYIGWSLRKPYGYAGDFKIIDDIYQNNPSTTGFDRLFDNYYQMSAICVAVRNRKEDFKRATINFINTKQNNPIKIMNLACGSARDIKEILSSNTLSNKNIT